MVGYSALSQRHETLALGLLEERQRLVRVILPRNGGCQANTAGDGFFVEFPGALAAARCAYAVQQSLHERRCSGWRPPSVRLKPGSRRSALARPGTWRAGRSSPG